LWLSISTGTNPTEENQSHGNGRQKGRDPKYNLQNLPISKF